MRIYIEGLKRLSLCLEYASFFLCFLYWLFYSIFRAQGVPIFFNGIEISNTLSVVIVIIILFFNSVFFSRLLVELISQLESLRLQFLGFVFRYLLPLSLILLLIVFVTGGRFDYASYKLQWNMVMAGGNPWGSIQGGMVNAYGYVFNFLATLYSINSLLPKLLFTLLLIYFSSRLASHFSQRNRVLPHFLCINPFTISTIAVYGFIDGMCSVLLGIALLDISKKGIRSSFQSGVFLSLSFLTKFYTIVALPLFLTARLESNKSRTSFTKGFLLTSSVVILLSYFLWGDAVVAPLLFAKGRDPSFLTLWQYVPHPEYRSIVFSLISILAIILASARKDLPCSLRTAAVLSIVFGAYYLGHQQFYLGIVLSLAVYIIEVAQDSSLVLRPSILCSFALMFGWLIFIQTGFELFDEFKPLCFQSILPLLSFLNSIILAASGLYWLTITRPVIRSRATSIT